MAKSAILAVKIIGDSSSASKAMGSAAQSASGFAAKMGAVSGIVQNVASKAFNVLRSSVDSAVSRVDTMNNFPKIMQNLGYSSQEATASIQKMSDKLSGLPTSLDEMAGMTQKLAPLTGGLGKATDLSLALNNALLAGGKGTAVAANAMEQYSQMLANGKPDLQSWRSMTDAMPGQMNQLAIAILGAGHNSMDLYESMKSGTTTFGQFNDAILQLNDHGINGFASFSKQAKDATNGIATSAQNMKTAVVRGLGNAIAKVSPFLTDMMGKATQGINDASKLAADGIGKITDYVQNSGLGSAVQSIITDAKTYIGPALEFVKSNVHDAFEALSQSAGPAMAGVKSAFKAVADVMAPFVDAIIGAKNQFSDMHLDTGMWTLAKDTISGTGRALEAVGGFVSRYKDPFQALAVSVGAIGGAFLAGKLAIAAWNGVLGAWNAITRIATAAQAAFNVVMNMNPIMLVVVAVAALTAGLAYFFAKTQTGQRIWEAFTSFLSSSIANIRAWFSQAGDWITEKWQGVQAFFSGIPRTIGGFFAGIGSLLSQPFNAASSWAQSKWEGLTSWFAGVPGRIAGFFGGIADTLTAPFRAAVNGIKNIWNSTVGGFGFDVPDWVPAVGGKSFKIPKLASGGILRAAGTVMVGEAGPELLTLPRGAQVTPLSRTSYNLGPSIPNKSPIIINLTVNGILDGEDGAKKIRKVLNDYAGHRR